MKTLSDKKLAFDPAAPTPTSTEPAVAIPNHRFRAPCAPVASTQPPPLDGPVQT
jgi:hypothetical protein